MCPRRQSRLVNLGAVVVLLGAILPNVLWLGHWNVPGPEAAHETAGANEHASHCHGNPSCADQAAYGLQFWSEMADQLILEGGPQREQAPEQQRSPTQPLISTPHPPPRYT